MTRHTQFYLNYIQSDAWKRKKDEIVKKRGWKCERCGEAGYVECHHKNYDRLGRERDSDLQLLCVDCHEKADRRRAARTRYQRGLETYTRKKYGEHMDPSEVAEEFSEWLERKREEY